VIAPLQSLRDGLCGAWCPSLGQSVTLIRDLSRYTNNATIASGSGSNWVASRYGTAVNFNGTSNYASFTPPAASQSGALSVSLWLLCRQLPANVDDGVLVSIGSGVNDRLYAAIQTSGGGNRFCFNGYDGVVRGIYSSTTPGPVAVANQWTHFCGVVSSTGTYTLYINGLSVASATSSLVNVSGAAGAMGAFRTPGRYYNGLLDDIRLYSRALLQAEVRLLATRPSIGLVPQRQRRFYPRKAWINVGETWKNADTYQNVGGTWKVTVPYINVGGTWK